MTRTSFSDFKMALTLPFTYRRRIDPLALEHEMARVIAKELQLQNGYRLREILPSSMVACQGQLDLGKSYKTNCHEIEFRRRYTGTGELKTLEERAYILGHEFIHALQVERDGGGCWKRFIQFYNEENDRVGYALNRFEIEATKRGLEIASRLCKLEPDALTLVKGKPNFILVKGGNS